MFAKSFGSPTFFKGWRNALASIFSGELNKRLAIGVFVSDGAIQFTRIFGANSAASDLVSHSIAPVLAATEA